MITDTEHLFRIVNLMFLDHTIPRFGLERILFYLDLKRNDLGDELVLGIQTVKHTLSLQ